MFPDICADNTCNSVCPPAPPSPAIPREMELTHEKQVLIHNCYERWDPRAGICPKIMTQDNATISSHADKAGWFILQEHFVEGLGLFVEENLVLSGVTYPMQPQDVLLNAQGEPGTARTAGRAMRASASPSEFLTRQRINSAQPDDSSYPACRVNNPQCWGAQLPGKAKARLE